MSSRIKNDTVAICLATYNGERYIDEQLESIITQSYKNWVLYIRDDGSTDATLEILRKYAQRYVGKIVVLEHINEKQETNSKNNFSYIVEYVKDNYDYDYYMTADQDDYWLPDKIYKSLLYMKKAEKRYPGVPILIHTGLKVVDERLNEISSSLFSYRSINPRIRNLNRLLVQNNATGCTMMWNRLLGKIVRVPSDKVITYDWWMTLTASCFGKIFYLKKPTVLYRQHRGNLLGAIKVNSLFFVFKRLKDIKYVKETIKNSVKQAEALLMIYHDLLKPSERKIIKRYAKLYEHKKFEREIIILQNGFLKQGVIQILGELLFI